MQDIHKESRLSIMQPYFFPYIGYFHLINSSDKIVFYDDVAFIKNGWINRNRLLLENVPHLFTVPLQKKSSFKLIKDTMVDKSIYSIWKIKFLKTIKTSYSKAPYFKPIYELVESVVNSDFESISDLAINSIISVYDYLGQEIKYTKSSIISPNFVELNRVSRLVEITQSLGYKRLINPIGGRDLYIKKEFKEKGVDLNFVQPVQLTYKQFNGEHVAWLSIIDILMFLDKEEILTRFSTFNIE